MKRKWNPLFQSKLSWTKPGNWHLTLKFIGKAEKDILPEIKTYVQKIDFNEFILKGSRAGFFGSKGQYRVIWLGLEGNVQSLINLAGKIDSDLN
ncbi:MAG: 2'-5' RNA ligase family protein, partial [Desulfonatronovibrio sp.]